MSNPTPFSETYTDDAANEPVNDRRSGTTAAGTKITGNHDALGRHQGWRRHDEL